MTQTFFWYDLETSGINPRTQRIMQFAGQRTDMDLNPVGDPVNVFVKLSEDILPEPDAVLLTGITPQQTLQDGLTEVEFLQLFHEQVATPGTIFVGYNTVRFDDEFMRCLHYRNFYDAYQWQWQDGRGRWDLLDVVRMTRALRPDGIQWPVTADGAPTNRLELITKLNGLDHEHAHDALNDVLASIAVAQLIRDKQPKLFAWLLQHRTKQAVQQFVNENPVFLYSTGKYANEVEKTAAVMVVGDDNQGVLVYDLRHDPARFAGMTAEQLVERLAWSKDPDAPARLPLKLMRYNRCPAVSPVSVLRDSAVQERLKITPDTIAQHQKTLLADGALLDVMREAYRMYTEKIQTQSQPDKHCDECLYDGFFSDHDCQLMSVIRAALPGELADIGRDLQDKRLQDMLPLYKARNFAQYLTDEERAAWETYRHQQLLDGGTGSRLAKFMHRLGELAQTEAGSNSRYLLEELQLYAESIMPVLDTD